MAYNDPYFSEMLPSNNDKIEHFISAYLGLTDPRRWQPKVDNRLKFTKAAMKEVQKESAAATVKNAVDERRKNGELYFAPGSPKGKAMQAIVAAAALGAKAAEIMAHPPPPDSPGRRIRNAMNENFILDAKEAIATQTAMHTTRIRHVK